jgi:phage anti-repressor protein
MTCISLIPFLTGNLGGQPQQLVYARQLHEFLGVRRDFSNWIRARIDAYWFEVDVDYLRVRAGEESGTSDSPKVANQTGRGGGRRSADYFLSLGMAKELAMVERTERGRQARRYFIDWEQQQRQLQRDLQAISRQAWADVVGEVRAAFHRRREALVHERVQALTHRTTERRLLPDHLVPSWAK